MWNGLQPLQGLSLIHGMVCMKHRMGNFMERTHLPLKLHLPASVTIGGCMSKEAIEQKEVIVGKLKDSGCRITKQRLILLDVILEGECGSCKEIYYRASKIDHSIGTATVYRMINTIEEIGAIDRKNMYRVQVS